MKLPVGQQARLSHRTAGDEDGYFQRAAAGTANLSELTFRVEDVQLIATSPLGVRFSPTEVFFEKINLPVRPNIVLGEFGVGEAETDVYGRRPAQFARAGRLSPDVLFGIPTFLCVYRQL